MITATQNTSLYQTAIIIAANRMAKMNEMDNRGVEPFKGYNDLNDETLHKDMFNDEQCD